MLVFITAALAQTAAPVLIDQAIDRIETGDYDGALILLDASESAPESDPDRTHYLRGVALELDGEPASALSLYTDGLDRWPQSALRQDRIFRAAEAHATLGDWRRSIRTLRKLDAEQFTGDDRVKLDLVTGIALLGKGKERKGLELLSPTLTDAAPDQVTFYQAKARIAWARLLASQADDLSLNGREKRVVERLETRAQRLVQVEEQVVAAARLQEPEWVLEGLLILGASYERVAEDLLNSTRPKGLTETQLAEYDALLAQRALIVFTKASQHYQSGLGMATRLGWQSRRVGQLEQAKSTLDARIVALDQAG